MTLEQVAALSQVVAAGGVIASLIFVGFPIRDSAKAVRSATAQAVHENFGSLYAQLAQNPQALDTFLKGCIVRSLVLVEPPLLRWLPDLPEGRRLYDEFVGGTLEPAGLAFRRGDTTEAMRLTLDFFIGPGSPTTLPAELRAVLFANVREWQALTTSRDAFPAVSPGRGPVARPAGAHAQRRPELSDAPRDRRRTGATAATGPAHGRPGRDAWRVHRAADGVHEGDSQLSRVPGSATRDAASSLTRR